MRILLDGRPLLDRSPGGVTRVTHGLIQALRLLEPEHRLSIATSGGRRSPFSTHHWPVPNKILNGLIGGRVASFDTFWSRLPADLLVFPNLGFIGRPRRPYLLVVHDLSFLIEPRWFPLKTRLWHGLIRTRTLVHGAKHVFSVSDCTARDLIHYCALPEARISRLPLGLSAVPPLADLPPELAGRRFFLAMGAGDRRKNIACAVQALQQLKQDQTCRDVQLVVIGNHPQNVIPNVIFFRRPDDAALNALMKHAAAFLYPSWYEGFGLPVHEAARHGTPCIVSTSGALPETAPSGSLFAPPHKPQLWTEAMREVLDHPQDHRTATMLTDWRPASQALQRVLNQ